jgi:hypothetical protein
VAPFNGFLIVTFGATVSTLMVTELTAVLSVLVAEQV